MNLCFHIKLWANYRMIFNNDKFEAYVWLCTKSFTKYIHNEMGGVCLTEYVGEYVWKLEHILKVLASRKIKCK